MKIMSQVLICNNILKTTSHHEHNGDPRQRKTSVFRAEYKQHSSAKQKKKASICRAILFYYFFSAHPISPLLYLMFFLSLSPVTDCRIWISLLSVSRQVHLICQIHYAAFWLSFMSKAWIKAKEKWDMMPVISLRGNAVGDGMWEKKKKETSGVLRGIK